jgi:sugar phosphate isomerase/epimerase
VQAAMGRADEALTMPLLYSRRLPHASSQGAAVKVAISSYSFFRFGQGVEATRPSFLDMLDRCVDLGVDGIELLGDHFDTTDTTKLGPIKLAAVERGIAICTVSALHNFVKPDLAERKHEIDVVKTWIDVAAFFGAPVVRVWGGRWRTIPNFEDFMRRGGDEPALAGYTDDDAFAWSIDAFKQVVPYAEQRGIVLGLENHWGLTGTAQGTMRILDSLGSPWLRLILDTGNFLPNADVAGELTLLAPRAIMVHAKTYLGGGLNYESRTDLVQALVALRNVGYRGYLSLEFEGKAHPDAGIPAGVAELRKAIAAAGT